MLQVLVHDAAHSSHISVGSDRILYTCTDSVDHWLLKSDKERRPSNCQAPVLQIYQLFDTTVILTIYNIGFDFAPSFGTFGH